MYKQQQIKFTTMQSGSITNLYRKMAPYKSSLTCPPAFQMPLSVQAVLLPDTELSVPAFMEFRFPPIARAKTASHDLQPSQIFSSSRPTVGNLEEIRNIPIPASSVIDHLMKCGKNAVDDGAQTVRFAPESLLLPLWIVTYWKLASDLRKNVQEPWLNAEEGLNNHARRFIHGKNLSEVHKLVYDAQKAIGSLLWSEKLSSYQVLQLMMI